jgi:hypothetical protein
MGRSSLIMVLGFSMALILKGFNLSGVSSDAYDNVVNYYGRAASHNIAVGVANMGCNIIYRVPNSFPTRTNLSFGGGTVNLWTKTVDTMGRIRLTTASNYREFLDTVSIVWGQSNFSKFAYYSNTEASINWATGDTIWGPFHTQDKMTVNYSPVFMGKVTNKLGMTKNPSSSTPDFHNGYQTGIDIPMPSDFTPLKNAAVSGGKYLRGKDVSIAFDSMDTGYMTIKVGTAAAQRVLITTYCPNGALVIDSANLRIKGIFKGQITIAVLSAGASNKGKMYLDSSVAYYRNPTVYTDPPPTDVLGLCAEDSIVITRNVNNQNNITIQGALFSLKSGLGAEQYNYDDNDLGPVVRGRINLLGGVSQKQRAAVGTLNIGGSLKTGFLKSYRYDNRLMTQSPPYFPTTGGYEILSWYE